MYQSLSIFTRAAAVAAIAAVALAAPAQSASPGGPRNRTYRDLFTSTTPGTVTGRHARTDIVNPSDPSAKPPAVRHITVRFARGTRIDTGAIPGCTASDAQIMGEGRAACPGGSILGVGEFDLDTGVIGPMRFQRYDFTTINAPGQLILLGTSRDQAHYNIDVRGQIHGNVLDVSVPPLPGGPPDGGADTGEILNIASRSRVVNGVRRNYMTTPRTCPRSRHWTNTVTFTFSDGVVQSFRANTPCKPKRKHRRHRHH